MKYLAYLFMFVGVFGVSYKYNTRLLDWLRFQSLGTRDYVADRLALMFIDIPRERVLLGMVLLSLVPAVFMFLAFLPNLAPGLLFGAVFCVIGWKAPRPIVDFMYKRRVDKFVVQMIDGLNLMANGLKSGLSVSQAMGLVVQEMPDPIKQEFNLILSETKLGVSLEAAFNNLAQRFKNDDVQMFVTSINILKETGGNLAETFDTIVITLRERIKVEKRIGAMTAQGLTQGVVIMLVPPLMGIVFYYTDPVFMGPMFTTPMGWLLLAIIVGLEVVGFFVIMKVVKVDV